MGGAVSSGSDNNELVDNLMNGNYIRSKKVEQVFRALDRAAYMTPESYDHAYKDLAWRSGPLHLSSPCIYSEVMEGLELSDGLSFLNIGSGTGYLSSLVGLILGSQGINHGVEVHPEVYEYALTKLAILLENSPIVDDFDFCQPTFFNGNGLCLVSLKSGYDRVYCGAACPKEYEAYFRNLIKVGGILVMPLNDTLVQVRRVSWNMWVTRSLLSVTFAPLRVPSKEESAKLLKLEEQRPPRLEVLSRGAVRAALRAGVMSRHPELRERTRRPPARARPAFPRRICIPVEPPAAVDGLNVLHDLDAENGADEMNALLSLVISMGHNRVAGALRFDRLESASDSDGRRDSSEDELTDEDGDHDVPRPPRRSTRSRTPQSLRETGHGSRNNKRNRDTNKRNVNKKRDSRSQKHGRSAQREDSSERSPSRTLCSRRRSARLSRQARDARETSETREPRDTEGSTPSTSGSTDSRPDSTQKLSKRKSKDCKNNSKQGKDSTASLSEDSLPDPRKTKSSRKSRMEWEENTDELCSDEDTESCRKSKAKRQKLDSGIGEGTPGSASDEHSDDYTDIEDDEEDAEDSACPKATAGRRSAGADDARCARVSELMRRGVAMLPLPPALNRFVNLDRNNPE